MTSATRVPDRIVPVASATRVDAWILPLDLPPGESRAVLNTAERAHAARLRVGGARWAASRAALRRVLGRYLGADPASLEYETGARGKPRLRSPALDLRFSLAHSDDTALLAVRLGHDVGADLERIRDDVDVAGIARTMFGPRERAELQAPGSAAPREAFFRAWTRREALAKSTGAGIAEPGAGGWTGHAVRELHGIPGFAAAVASEGADWTLALAANIEGRQPSPRAVTR